MYIPSERSPRVSTCWRGHRPPPPEQFRPVWRNDSENIRIAEAWTAVITAQEALNERHAPFNLSWSIPGGDPMPMFIKNGQGCLFDDHVLIAGGIQWTGQFGPFNFTQQPCQADANPKCCGCNYLMSYGITTGKWNFLKQPPFFFRRTQGACDAERLYLVGGTGEQLSPGAPPFQKVVAFDWPSQSWVQLPDFPDFRWLATAATLQDSPGEGRWLVAGFGTVCLKGVSLDATPPHLAVSGAWPPSPPFSPPCTEDQDLSNLPGYRLQLGNASATWQQIAPFSGKPGSRIGLSSIGIGSDWYIFGGRVELPSQLDNAWTLASSAESPHGFGQAATNGAGGTLVHSDAYRYNVEMDTWTRLSDMPAPNDGGSTPIVIDRRWIILFGSSQQVTSRLGHSAGDNGPGSFSGTWHGWGDDVFCYDTQTDTWTRPGLMLYGVKTAAVVFNGSHAWLFGGEPTTALNGNTENVVQLARIDQLIKGDSRAHSQSSEVSGRGS